MNCNQSSGSSYTYTSISPCIQVLLLPSALATVQSNVDAVQHSNCSLHRPLEANCLGIAFVSCCLSLTANTGASLETAASTRTGRTRACCLVQYLVPFWWQVNPLPTVVNRAWSPHVRLGWALHTLQQTLVQQRSLPHCPAVLCGPVQPPSTPHYPAFLPAFPPCRQPCHLPRRDSAAQCLQGLMFFPRVF